MGTGQKQRKLVAKTYTAIIGKADTVNKNGHIYPKEALEEAIEKFRQDDRSLFLYPYRPNEDGCFVRPLGFANDVFLNSETGELCAKVVVLPSQQQEFEALKSWGNSIVVNFYGYQDCKDNISKVKNCELSEMMFTARPSWDCCRIED